MRSSTHAFLVLAVVAAACARASVEQPSAPSGTAASSSLNQPGTTQMTTPRSNHAAILLHDGRVLICGGSSNNQIGGVLASAELYADPDLVATGSMSIPRAGHTLTLLNDGRVLVIGGIRNVGYRATLASAELYDPATGTFTPTGSMSTPRQSHTAILLRDGTVLVAGGSPDGIGALSSAEIYDPQTGKFHLTGNMAMARQSHTATLLIGGKILITGGARGNTPGGYIAYDTSEIYDPATGRFSPGPRMATDRLGQTATLLHDASVLVAAGRSSRTGFSRSFTALKSAEIFDPESTAFITVGSMRVPRFLQTATLLHDGEVLIVGGWNLFGPIGAGMAEAELYDPSTRAFAVSGRTHVARVTHTATLLPDGEVMVAGGVDSLGKVTASVEFYDPARRQFTLLPAAVGLPSPIGTPSLR
jgi:hypothetical protein